MKPLVEVAKRMEQWCSILCKTKNIFERDLLLPEPPPELRVNIESITKDCVTEYGKCNALRRKCHDIYSMRCWQIRKMGFREILPKIVVELMMGHMPNGEGQTTGKKQKYEWVYNHHTGEHYEGKKCKWGSFPYQWHRVERRGLWNWLPFAKKERWRIQMGKINYLKCDIPFQVGLNILKVKELNLFNCFDIIAPMPWWKDGPDCPCHIPPVILGSVWELPPSEYSCLSRWQKTGKVAYYFLGEYRDYQKYEFLSDIGA